MARKLTCINYYKRLLLKYPEYILFGLFILFNIIKYFLITNLSNEYFLATYKFVSSDSYDWLANGIRLFENDSISYRNPGLPLIINLLYRINALFILPLINQGIYILLAIYLYKICKIITSKNIALLITFLFLINFSFNVGANMILADYYAVLLITASIYYILEKRYKLSFLALFTSLVFQNLAIFFIPIWLIKVIKDNWSKTREIIINKNVEEIIKIVTYFLLTSLPFSLWLLFKFIKFGNPFYDNIGYLGVVNPNFDSVLFYLINTIPLFSPMILLVGIYFLFKPRIFLNNKTISFLIAGLLVNIFFWVIIYDWDDRRFLVYFIPWTYPLVAFFVSKTKINFKYLIPLLFIIFYPTTLPTTSFLASNEIPLIHNIYLSLPTYKERLTLVKNARTDFDNILMNVNPTMYNAFVGSEYYRLSESTWYSYYSDYINNHYNEKDNSLCLDKEKDLRQYPLTKILQIYKNADLNSIIINDCP